MSSGARARARARARRDRPHMTKRPAAVGDSISLRPLHELMHAMALDAVAPPLITRLAARRAPPPDPMRAGFATLDAVIARMDELLALQVCGWLCATRAERARARARAAAG